MKSVADRFNKFVFPITECGCWVWMGTITSARYGSFRIGERLHSAHRVSYELTYGQVPVGLQLDHICRIRCCVNPNHLEPVTNA